MKWLLFAVPAVGVGLYFLFAGSSEAEAAGGAVAPPPPGPGATPSGRPGGTRAQQYLLRIQMAVTAWRAALPVARQAQETLLVSTIDVVLQMAAQDVANGNITTGDYQAIEGAAKTAKAEIAEARALA